MFTNVVILVRCMNDSCYMLCQECDKVFHKSAVKKSHIRIPVLSNTIKPLSPSGSLERLSLSRDRSISLKETTFSLNEHESTVGVSCALHHLVLELNDCCKQPLIKNNMLDPSNNRIHAGDSTALGQSTIVSHHNSLFVESMVCFMLAGVRGILDDQKV